VERRCTAALHDGRIRGASAGKSQHRRASGREAAADLLEVVQDESVSVCQPPIGVDPFGRPDHVWRLHFTVDGEGPKSVTLEPRHRLTAC
jgi:hypothetical protein